MQAVCPDSSDQDARTHVLALEALSVQSAAQYPAAQFEVVCKVCTATDTSTGSQPAQEISAETTIPAHPLREAQ